MPIPYIPLELVLIILKTCQQNSNHIVLGHCALVCHSWRHASQRLLFDAVQVQGEERHGQFEDKLQTLREHSDLAQYVTHITFNGRQDWGGGIPGLDVQGISV